MKKYLTVIVVAAVVLAIAVPVLAQPVGGDRRRDVPPEERAGWKDRLQNMSEEEREKFREEMRQRREQWQNMSQEEREKFRAEIRERFGGTPPSTRPPTARPPRGGGEGTPRMFEQQIARMKQKHQESINELNAILELAEKEKAKKTAARLEKLIAKQEQEFQESLKTLEQRRQRLEKIRRDRPPTRPDAVEPEGARRAPAFTLSTFDGKEVNLTDYRGKIVVLEWFNFECPFVMYHYGKPQTMTKLSNKYKDKNVVWLAINSTNHTTPEANNEFVRKQKLPYPILDDRSGRVGRAYGAKTTPHMYIISPRGSIVYEGAIDNAPNGKAKGDLINYVDNALAELTTGKRVSTTESKPYGCSVKYAQR
jgi:peroxiredoxin